MICILPAAGKGSRMSRITGGGAKELLTVGGKAVLQWAIDEAESCNPDRVVVISSPDKPEMNDYLGQLGPDIETLLQFVQDGLAPAIALAATDDSALVILPDTLYHPSQPSSRMARALSEGFDIVLLTEAVPSDQIKLYGIVETDSQGTIRRVVEKPALAATESRQAVAGRYGFSARMLEFILQTIEALDEEVGEIGLTPILNLAIKNDLSTIALPTLPTEVRYDCGSAEGYARAKEAITFES